MHLGQNAADFWHLLSTVSDFISDCPVSDRYLFLSAAFTVLKIHRCNWKLSGVSVPQCGTSDHANGLEKPHTDKTRFQNISGFPGFNAWEPVIHFTTSLFGRSALLFGEVKAVTHSQYSEFYMLSVRRDGGKMSVLWKRSKMWTCLCYFKMQLAIFIEFKQNTVDLIPCMLELLFPLVISSVIYNAGIYYYKQILT